MGKWGGKWLRTDFLDVHLQCMSDAGWKSGSVPTLVPKPASPTVTQEHPPGGKSDALGALESPWVRSLLSHKLKISRDIRNSRRLSFYIFLNTATKHNSLDSRSHDPAKSNVGAAV